MCLLNASMGHIAMRCFALYRLRHLKEVWDLIAERILIYNKDRPLASMTPPAQNSEMDPSDWTG